MNLLALCPWITFWMTIKGCQPLIFKSYKINITISKGNFRDQKKKKDEQILWVKVNFKK